MFVIGLHGFRAGAYLRIEGLKDMPARGFRPMSLIGYLQWALKTLSTLRLRGTACRMPDDSRFIGKIGGLTRLIADQEGNTDFTGICVLIQSL